MQNVLQYLGTMHTLNAERTARVNGGSNYDSPRSAIHMFGSRTMVDGEVRHTRLDVAGSLAGRSCEPEDRVVVNR